MTGDKTLKALNFSKCKNLKLKSRKNWKNTQVYADSQEIRNSVGDEWYTTVAETIDEACKLIAEGWTVACEFGEAKIFKKESKHKLIPITSLNLPCQN